MTKNSELALNATGCLIISASVVLILWTHCRWQTLTGIGVLLFTSLLSVAMKDD
jgi:hypothetical protein